MLVSQIIKDKGDQVFTIGPEETVGAVAVLLLERRVGALIVLEDERVAGIVSERDIVRAIAEAGAAALDRPLRSYMTADVHTAAPTDTVHLLLAQMTDRRIRHLPVVHGERLCGIVSIGDLVKSKIAETEAEAEGLKSYIAAG